MKRRRRRKNPSGTLLLWAFGVAVVGAGAAVYFINKKQVAAALALKGASAPPSSSSSTPLPTAGRPADIPLNIGVQDIPAGMVVTNPDGSTTTITDDTNSSDLANMVNIAAAGGITFGSTWRDAANGTLIDTLLSDGTVSQISQDAS